MTVRKERKHYSVCVYARAHTHVCARQPGTFRNHQVLQMSFFMKTKMMNLSSFGLTYHLHL